MYNMIKNAPQFTHPPRMQTAKGDRRNVGIELECLGMELPALADEVHKAYGGTVTRINEQHYEVTDTSWGTFRIERDVSWLQKLAEHNQEELSGLANGISLGKVTEDVLTPIMSSFMPNEIVTPPIPMDELEKIEILREALNKGHAQGTGTSPIHAFGVHLNPETPDTDSATLLGYLQAFVLLYDWLEEETHMDITRKIGQFAVPYPKDYGLKITSPDYAPDTETLINDYLDANPTRDRALDMLPLFTWIDESRVRGRLSDTLIKKRPTFHYRLPNCQVDDPDWTIAHIWNQWVEVEKLADDNPRRSEIAEAYHARQDGLLTRLTAPSWKEQILQWL